ncbi:MAG: FG-GAP repeat protein, partial [Pseudomonadota bacterium]|nr:FG-GAP repeat protein [Pseudomonadota bacterium]
DNGSGSGSAYVFTGSGASWIQQDKLLASDGASGDQFGRDSVAIDGDTALIGVPYDDNGSAYVFIYDDVEEEWIEQDKLIADDGASGDYFGEAVDLSGDRALIGAWGDDDYGNYTGSAYVFIRSGTSWSQQDKLLADDGASGDYFGHDVSLDGDMALIGSHSDDDNGSASGSAYVIQVP